MTKSSKGHGKRRAAKGATKNKKSHQQRTSARRKPGNAPANTAPAVGSIQQFQAPATNASARKHPQIPTIVSSPESMHGNPFDSQPRASSTQRDDSASSIHRANTLAIPPISTRHMARSFSDHDTLSALLPQYISGIDAEDVTDILASRYYGNMADIPEGIDRVPRPMLSTLPLFSPSVTSRRQRRDTSAALASLPLRPQHSTKGSSSSRPSAPHSPSANHPHASPNPFDGQEGYGGGGGTHVPENTRAERVSESDACPHESTRSHTTPQRPVQSSGASRAGAPLDEQRGDTTGGDKAKRSENSTDTLAHSDDASRCARTRPSDENIGHSPNSSVSGANTAGSKNGRPTVLGSKSGSACSSSQMRASKTQSIGTTQYKPAAQSKRSAMTRGAPGLSYMFSPVISSSRPTSVMGMSGPPANGDRGDASNSYKYPPLTAITPTMNPLQKPAYRTESSAYERVQYANDSNANLLQDPGFESKYSNDNESSGAIGGVRLGVLEQFLTTGEVPSSTSEEEDDGSSSQFSYQTNTSNNSWTSTRSHSLYSDSDSAEDRPRSSQGLCETAVQNALDSSSVLAPQLSDKHQERSESTIKSAPDEQMPLLSSMAVRTPPNYSFNGRLLGAADDAPGIQRTATRETEGEGELSEPRDAKHESIDFMLGDEHAGIIHSDNRSLYRGPYKSRRKRRHRRPRQPRDRQASYRDPRTEHEKLFLDKDGFIDESYRFTFFNPEIGTIRSQELADLRTPTMDLVKLLQVGGCFWIDVLRPSFQEMQLISKIFSIHELNVEDIMLQDIREKCEVHANYYFVCFRSFDNDPSSEAYLEPKCLYNVVMREGILTFHMEPSIHQYHVLRRIRQQADHIVVTPDWLNYAIIDDVTDLLAPIMHFIEFEVDAIDELVLVISSLEQSDMLLRISTVRKRIMMVLRLLQGKADVVRALIKRFETVTALTASQVSNVIAVGNGSGGYGGNSGPGGPQIDRTTMYANDTPKTSSEAARYSGMLSAESTIDATNRAIEAALTQRKGHETLLYLGDVLDHIITMSQNAGHYDNSLGRAHANYLAQISIELTESSNRTNDVVAKLSALAAIVVPLNIVTGLWGMNVPVPGQESETVAWFFSIVAFLLLFVVLVLLLCRRVGIL